MFQMIGEIVVLQNVRVAFRLFESHPITHPMQFALSGGVGEGFVCIFAFGEN
jgi:hypothetical protein